MSLDHVGLVGSSITEMRQAWMDAGFFVTAPEELMAFDPTTGERVSLDQHSCHVILERGYIELTAVTTVTPRHHLYPWIRRDVSLGIIALGTDDIDAEHVRLIEAGVPVGPIATATRPIHYGARRGDALFRWFAINAASTPEALVCFVRNERPELVYQPEVQQHPNGARTLDSLIICSHDPAATAARYATYTGAAAIESGPGLIQCTLGPGVVWVGTPAALRKHFDHDVVLGPDEPPRSIGWGVSPGDRLFWVSATSSAARVAAR